MTENKQDWRDMMCSGCRKVDKSYCYPCGAIRITEAEISAAVAKERERVGHVIEAGKRLHDEAQTGFGVEQEAILAFEVALKNYEEGK